MIISKLQGGLGNQLFQWANGYSLSKEYNTDLVFDKSFYDIKLPSITERKYKLNLFPMIENQTIDKISLSSYPKIIQEKKLFDYQEIDIRINTNYYLDGYWQSYLYFDKNISDIKKNLSIRLELPDSLQNLLDGETISLHIRRSDYLLYKNDHHILDKSYYDKALSILPRYDNLLVFSDDTDWCRNNLDYSNMFILDKNMDIVDMQLMSMCKHNIIANSSFSWWGAWLNNNYNKTVVCPNTWFKKYLTNQTKLCPPEWIVI